MMMKSVQRAEGSRRLGRQLVAGAACLWMLLCCGSAQADDEVNKLTRTEIEEGWILLFDGESLFGWEAATKANWAVKDGTITVDEGEPGLLCTTSEFGDFMLHVEFRNPPTTNSGIFLRTPLHPKDPATDCYELNIATPELSPYPTGSLVQREQGMQGDYSTEWHSYDLTFFNDRISVRIDGSEGPTLQYTDPKPVYRGRIGLQFNTGKVAFRNIKLKPVGLNRLFNGDDLTGWKVFPGKKSTFTVVDGEIDVKSGPGTLESEAQFQDFVLQLDAKTNGAGLNSGVFFRCIPGEYNNGYESQIQNAVKENDRTKPVDCGTGGIYRRVNARRVVSNDLEWLTQTIVATGPHLSVWVDGFPVTDWTDERPADANPRKGYRADAGTIQLQGHDPTTDLRFRNIRAVETRK